MRTSSLHSIEQTIPSCHHSKHTQPRCSGKETDGRCRYLNLIGSMLLVQRGGVTCTYAVCCWPRSTVSLREALAVREEGAEAQAGTGCWRAWRAGPAQR